MPLAQSFCAASLIFDIAREHHIMVLYSKTNNAINQNIPISQRFQVIIIHGSVVKHGSAQLISELAEPHSRPEIFPEKFKTLYCS